MLTLNDGRTELWQWDTGRTLAVDADCSQVHFSNKVFGRSIDVDVIDGVAIIPDILLQTDKDLNVWAFVGTAENGYTKISKTFKVNRRNKPADYVFTQTDQITLQTIQRQIGDLSDLTTEAKDTLVAAINEAARTGGGGGGSTVELDTTLTKSGKAADAAAVGDRLSSLSEEIVTTAESKVAAHNTGETSHSDIRLLIQGLTDRINALADSDDTTLDQLSEVVAYIKSNRTLIEAITTSKVSVADIIDNLTTNVTNKPLSAAQGVALKSLIDGIVIPDKLPNPNALTFTGAVSGSYDGSEPVTVAIPSGVAGGGAWHTIGTQMMDGAEAAVSFDLAGETIIQIMVTSSWGTALTATKATVSLTLANGETVQFTPQTMNATSFTPKNIFTVFGNSKYCRQMIFSKAEGAQYSSVQGSFGVAFGYSKHAENIVEDAIATGITITFDNAPSNAAIVKVEGM